MEHRALHATIPLGTLQRATRAASSSHRHRRRHAGRHLSAITENTTVDSTVTPEVMRSMTWGLRGLKSSNVTFMTVPTKGTGYVGEASMVFLDHEKCKTLFAAVKDDLMLAYMHNNKTDQLPNPSAVN